jgi:hypothetical protein
MAGKHFTFRVPEDLWQKIGNRCMIQCKKPAQVILDAVADSFLQKPARTEAPARPPRTNPLDIPGVFLGSQLGQHEPDEIDVPSSDVPQCAYSEYVGEIGETMRCGFPEHSAKAKHGNWQKL